MSRDEMDSCVLADGSVFEGDLIGAARRRDRHRRGRVQHRAQRLPGGDHRPELRRPDHHLHVPAHRQLRRSTPTDFESRRHVLPWRRRARPRPPAAATTARRPTSTRCCYQQGVPGIAGIDTRRLTRLIRDTGAMPGAFGAAPNGRIAAPPPQAEPGTDGVDLVRTGHDARRLHGRGGRPRQSPSHRRLDFGIKTQHRAQPRRRSATVDVVPAHDDAPPTSWRWTPTACSCRNGPGDPEMAPYAVDDDRAAARQRADLRDLPRPPAARPGDRRRHGQAAVRSPRRQPSGARTCTTGRIEITSQNHNFAVDAELARRPNGRDDPRQPQRRRLRGAARSSASGRSACSTTPRPSPGPHDANYLFAQFAELMDERKGGRLMPRRTDIDSILIIGSGPIVIGQACEFDYSGTQACRVLREEGYRVILANSNPATIMTDPDFADATYIEPLTWEVVSRDHRAGAARRRAADARWPDRAQPRDGAVRARPDRRARHAGDDRRQRRGDRHGRGPREVQGGDDRDRPRVVPLAASPHDMDEARKVDRRDRAARHHPPGLHPRRPRHRASPRPIEEFERMAANGPRRRARSARS